MIYSCQKKENSLALFLLSNRFHTQLCETLIPIMWPYKKTLNRLKNITSYAPLHL